MSGETLPEDTHRLEAVRLTPTERTAAIQEELAGLRAECEAWRLEHQEKLEGWREAVWEYGPLCPACQNRARRLVHPAGYLVPTEPDPEARQATRLELRAAIQTLDGVIAAIQALEGGR